MVLRVLELAYCIGVFNRRCQSSLIFILSVNLHLTLTDSVRHGVLNLTHTIGVTQNFCNERNFEQVWRETRSGRKLMAAKWMNQLDVHYPELGNKARMLNRRDNFVMRHDPVVVKRRDDAKARSNAISSSNQRDLMTESNRDAHSSVTSDSSSSEHDNAQQQQRRQKPSVTTPPSERHH